MPQIVVSYTHDDPLVRFGPRLQLRDLDDAMFMPMLNASLAKKVALFNVFANGYHLLAIGLGGFYIDRSAHDFPLPCD